MALRVGDKKIIDVCMENILLLEGYISPGQKCFPIRRDLLITAIIPLYNGARFIQQSLESIFAQEIVPDEIIVVDDGSTDCGTAIVEKIAEKHSIRLIRKENGGQSSARNVGVDHAHGDLIAFLDQDDIWYPNHLTELVKPFLESRATELGWVYSNLDEVNEAGEMIALGMLDRLSSVHPKPDLASCLKQDMFVLPSASLISRKAFRSVSGFDERLSGYEDDDFFLRVFVAGFSHVYLPSSLSKWRIYPTSSSYTDRMAKSRAIYAKKLISCFADDLDLSRWYVRDLIVPRFLRQAVEAARLALRVGDVKIIDVCMQNILILESYISPNQTSFSVRQDLLITAIIPLYNGAPFIRQSLESIFAQEVVPDEIIVVDDGSTDSGAAIVEEIAEKHPVRLIRKENGGQSSARNIGVDHAHGDLIAFLDQDDIWYPNHLSELLKPFLEKRAVELGWAYSDLDEINEAGEMIAYAILGPLGSVHPKRDLNSCLKQDMFVLPSASLISRKAFRSVGGFDERLSGYEDDDFFLRLFLAGYDNVFLPLSLSKWRIFPTSSSYSERMSISRAIYAKKLISRFPNDLDRSRWHVRDLIAPRFFQTMAAEMRKATLKGTREQQKVALANLEFITGHQRLSDRLLLQVFLFPALRVPPVARLIMRHRIGLSRLLRRLSVGTPHAL